MFQTRCYIFSIDTIINCGNVTFIQNIHKWLKELFPIICRWCIVRHLGSLQARSQGLIRYTIWAAKIDGICWLIILRGSWMWSFTVECHKYLSLNVIMFNLGFVDQFCETLGCDRCCWMSWIFIVECHEYSSLNVIMSYVCWIILIGIVKCDCIC